MQLELATGPSLIWADRDRLVQVMVNLLSNAAKFSPCETGRIRIRLVAYGARWRVCRFSENLILQRCRRRLLRSGG